MKILFALTTFLFISHLHAETQKGLERINFFPDVKAFARMDYQNQNLLITTPQNAVNDSEVRNNKNIFSGSYAHRLDNIFLGLKVSYEIVSESAANYGIPSVERQSSQGYSEPTFFLLSRLREQAGTTGNIDAYISYSDSWGAREAGGSTSNRLNGFNILTAAISHGLHEDEWEFRNALTYVFYDEGEEHNKFTNNNYQIGSFNFFRYSFTGQYEMNPWLFVNASAEFEYRTVQKISDKMGERREIQAGTGSIFRLGAKKPMNEWSVLEVSAELERYDYFVQGDTNFDGKATQVTYTISYVYGF